MNCPKCNSTEVRLSTRARWFDRFLAFGRQRFRCRNCHRRFHAREKAGPSADASGTAPISKRPQKHRHKPLSKPSKRRLLEAAIFVVMLALFFVFLRYLTREPVPDSPVSGASFELNTRIASAVRHAELRDGRPAPRSLGGKPVPIDLGISDSILDFRPAAPSATAIPNMVNHQLPSPNRTNG
jgi:hypothetical protein